MKLATAKQIQELDRIAIEDYGIESLFLMENAGRAVADEVAKTLKNSKNKKIAVFCGKGNNGGDGFVAARYLINKGFEVKNFLSGKVKEITSDAKTNLDLFLKMDQEIILVPDEKSFRRHKDKLKGINLIIDALLGVGLKGEIRQPYKTIINFLNKSKKTIISVDVPSGLDATTGEPLGVCIKAEKTVTFGLAKTGFFKNQGPKFAGRLKVVDIGWPKNLIRSFK
ncbi:MAG: NAD(P)H-hydrate epimerase [Candidatus Omnitrophica bacterium]|nr:NAD(P)H-hydrate epimerase [Candidatus Omnitrophota bacterium]